MGNLASGKSALVHRYLTGTYVQEESPEGKSVNRSLCLHEVWLDLFQCFLLVLEAKYKNPKHPALPRSPPPLSKIKSMK